MSHCALYIEPSPAFSRGFFFSFGPFPFVSRQPASSMACRATARRFSLPTIAIHSGCLLLLFLFVLSFVSGRRSLDGAIPGPPSLFYCSVFLWIHSRAKFHPRSAKVCASARPPLSHRPTTFAPRVPEFANNSAPGVEIELAHRAKGPAFVDQVNENQLQSRAGNSKVQAITFPVACQPPPAVSILSLTRTRKQSQALTQSQHCLARKQDRSRFRSRFAVLNA